VSANLPLASGVKLPPVYATPLTVVRPGTVTACGFNTTEDGDCVVTKIIRCGVGSDGIHEVLDVTRCDFNELLCAYMSDDVVAIFEVVVQKSDRNFTSFSQCRDTKRCFTMLFNSRSRLRKYALCDL